MRTGKLPARAVSSAHMGNPTDSEACIVSHRQYQNEPVHDATAYYDAAAHDATAYDVPVRNVGSQLPDPDDLATGSHRVPRHFRQYLHLLVRWTGPGLDCENPRGLGSRSAKGISYHAPDQVESDSLTDPVCHFKADLVCLEGFAQESHDRLL
jgi:hypothetical protein